MRTAIPIVIAACFASAPMGSGAATAAELYVNNVAGDDHFNGLAAASQDPENGPVRTITRALALAWKGDRIIVANTGTPYRESITLEGGRHSGTTLRPFVLEGNGATLDGSQPIPRDAWETFDGPVFRFRPPKMAHQQLFLDGQPLPRRRVEEFGRVPELEPREWCLFDGWIYFRSEWEKLPPDYNLSYAAEQTGITLYEVWNLAVVDLTIEGYQLDGLNAHDGVSECVVAGLTSRANGRSGISIGGASRVTISGCLLGDNGEVQLRTEGVSKVTVEDSEIVAGAAAAILHRGSKLTLDGDLFVEPLSSETSE